MTYSLIASQPKLLVEAAGSTEASVELVRTYTKPQAQALPCSAVTWYRGPSVFAGALETLGAGATTGTHIYYNKTANYWVEICPAVDSTGYYKSSNLTDWEYVNTGISITTTLATLVYPVVIFSASGTKIVICNRSTTNSINYIYSNDSGATWATSTQHASTQLASNRPLIFAGEELVTSISATQIAYATPGGTWSTANRGGNSGGAPLMVWDTGEPYWWGHGNGVNGSAVPYNAGVPPATGTNYANLSTGFAAVSLVAYLKDADAVVCTFPAQGAGNVFSRTTGASLAGIGAPATGDSNTSGISISKSCFLTYGNGGSAAATYQICNVPQLIGGTGVAWQQTNPWYSFLLPETVLNVHFYNEGGEIYYHAADINKLNGYRVRCKMDKTITVTE